MKVVKSVLRRKNGIFDFPVGEFTTGNFEHPLVCIYPVERQKITGFGGAFTDSSAYNYARMPETEKKKTLELLFGETGLKYNFCRLCIGSDFATEEFCYVQDGDETLTSFSIERDKKYVIPFIKDAMSYAKEPITFFASPWSPPKFMKTNDSRFQGGELKKEYYGLYAEYIVKFLKAYQNEGIEIFALTLQNEPKAKQTWESCFFSPEAEREFSFVLKDTLKKHGFSTKLLCWDHNKERLFDRANAVLKDNGILDGIAYHWYSGDHFDGVKLVRELFPDTLLLETEFCLTTKEDRVDTAYAHEYLNSLKSGANGITEWNMILDTQGGPYHNRKGGCLAPVIFDENTKTVTPSATYFESFIFTHFIEKGAKTLCTSSFDNEVGVSAFENPDGRVIINVFNETGKDFPEMKLYIDGQFLAVPIYANDLITLVLEK